MRSFGCDAIYWMTSLFGIHMWRHERQVFIFFGTLTATIKNQNTQKNAIINKIFLKQQHANCKVTQVLWISNWAVLLRLLKQDKSRTEGNPVNSSYNITLLLKYMIKRIKHGKIRITCRITLDQYHPSGLKALGLILVSSRWCLVSWSMKKKVWKTDLLDWQMDMQRVWVHSYLVVHILKQ